jgi:uncharacterized membrane protein YfcA
MMVYLLSSYWMQVASWLLLAGLWAGVQNALAGGGSFVTLPALILAGLDARAANITSTIALFPGQVTTGLVGRRLVAGAESLSFHALFVISLAGGVVGAFLLLETPAGFFAKLVPWLVLFATGIFAWESFFGKPTQEKAAIRPLAAGGAQFLIAVYGGYFGGGISLLMLATLTAAGVRVQTAEATKNALAGVMNASAVAVFVFSGDVHWLSAFVLGVGAIAGGLVGTWLLKWVKDRVLRIGVVALGVTLTTGLFLYAP